MTATFTLTQLLAFGTFLLALIGIMIRVSWAVWRLKKNDLNEFIKRTEFEGLEKEVRETGKTVVRLDERSKEQGKDIDSLFEWKHSK